MNRFSAMMHEPAANSFESRSNGKQSPAEWTDTDATAQTWLHDADSPREQFARRFGFESFLGMLRDSSSVKDSRDPNWRLSELADGRWIIWHEVKLVVIESRRPPEPR